MKTCSLCKTSKSLDEYWPDRRPGRTHYARCKTCSMAATTLYRKKNAEKVRQYEREQYALKPHKRARHLKIKYGITMDQYESLLATQGGCCAICRTSAEVLNETLAVDHDHKTGAVRGLLCAKCNRMLGCAIDLPETLIAGAKYLRNAQQARIFIEVLMEHRP